MSFLYFTKNLIVNYVDQFQIRSVDHFFDQFQIRSFAIGRGFETKNNRFELLNLKRLFRRISTDFFVGYGAGFCRNQTFAVLSRKVFSIR